MIQQDHDLSAFNTLSVPSRALHYIHCESAAELPSAWAEAKAQGESCFLLGGGSNVLLPERIPGTVLHLCATSVLTPQVLADDDAGIARVRCDAAMNWHAFVMWCGQHHFYGLENLALIPGTVGAAPVQNIGAYGVEVASHIDAVHVLDLSDGERKTLTSGMCQFAYRDSVFKRDAGRSLVILSVDFRLQREPALTLTYPALRDYLELHGCSPSPDTLREAVIAIRSAKLPQPEAIPNAGSFFKNPIVPLDHAERLRARYPDMPIYPVEGVVEQKKIPAAWLIDKAGWKSRNIDGVQVHAQQALVVINPLRRPLGSILQFAQAVQEDIEQRYGIVLEMEPQPLRALSEG